MLKQRLLGGESSPARTPKDHPGSFPPAAAPQSAHDQSPKHTHCTRSLRQEHRPLAEHPGRGTQGHTHAPGSNCPSTAPDLARGACLPDLYPSQPLALAAFPHCEPWEIPGARAPLQSGAPAHTPTCFGGQGLDRGAPQSHTRSSGLALPCHICVPSGKGPHPSKPSVLVCQMGALLVGRRRVRGAKEGEWWAQKPLPERWLVFRLPDGDGH